MLIACTTIEEKTPEMKVNHNAFVAYIWNDRVTIITIRIVFLLTPAFECIFLPE